MPKTSRRRKGFGGEEMEDLKQTSLEEGRDANLATSTSVEKLLGDAGFAERFRTSSATLWYKEGMACTVERVICTIVLANVHVAYFISADCSFFHRPFSAAMGVFRNSAC